MKRFTFLLTALFALVFGQTAYAQLGVMTSDDDARYEYNIQFFGTTGGNLGVNTGSTTFSSQSGTAVKFIFKSSGDSNYPYALYYVVDGDRNRSNPTIYPVVLTDNHLSYSTEDGTTALNVSYSSTPQKCSKNGTNMIYYWGVNIKSNGYTWNAPDAGYIGQSSGTSLTDSRPYWMFRFIPAAPAPMIFTAGSTYCTYSTGVAATIPEGVTAYTGTLGDDEVTLTEISGTTIPADLGVILALSSPATERTVYNPEASSETPTLSSVLTATCKYGVVEIHDNGSTPTYSNTGSIVVTKADGTNYYGLGSYTDSETNESVQAFLPFSETSTITMPAYKAYLTTSATAGSIKLKFPDGSTTSINGVNVGEKVSNGAIYDLSGRRVAAPVKGNLYIQNGKKYIAE